MKLKVRKRQHQGDRFRTLKKNNDGTREVESRFVRVSPFTNKDIYR